MKTKQSFKNRSFLINGVEYDDYNQIPAEYKQMISQLKEAKQNVAVQTSQNIKQKHSSYQDLPQEVKDKLPKQFKQNAPGQTIQYNRNIKTINSISGLDIQKINNLLHLYSYLFGFINNGVIYYIQKQINTKSIPIYISLILTLVTGEISYFIAKKQYNKLIAKNIDIKPISFKKIHKSTFIALIVTIVSIVLNFAFYVIWNLL